jgi:hypothetical protein
MRVEMKRQAFDSLDDISLIWACIEPAVRRLQGKSFPVKSAVFSELTGDQRALLMFQILYGHMSGGLAAFFRQLSYLLIKKEVWSEMKAGMRRFGDGEMLRLIGEMEEAFDRLSENGKRDMERPDDVCGGDGLQVKIAAIETALMDRLPEAAKRIGAYIREYRDQFVQMAD